MEKVLLGLLKEQVLPAFGCTEPIAVAYGVAKAKDLLATPVTQLDILVDKNVYKNAVAVFIPGTGQRGITVAAALALICGNPEYRLQVLKDCKPQDLEEASKLVDQGFIDVGIKRDAQDLYIEIVAKGHGNTAQVVIQGKHDNIVYLKRNDEVLLSHDLASGAKEAPAVAIQDFSILDLVNFVEGVDLGDLEIIREGIQMNNNMALAWFKENSDLALGYLDKKTRRLDEFVKARTAAACLARMTGYPLPVMSCAGSGNHGITALVPVAAVGEVKEIEEEKVLRAVALSALITIYIKSYTKTLSPVCGCAVAAGIGASAGIAFLLGGDQQAIEGAINNMVGGLSGMLCDGGKPGCAFKLSIAAGTALDAALMALKGEFISPLDGIVDKTVEKSIQNLGVVSTLGMSNTDDIILEVMLRKASC